MKLGKFLFQNILEHIKPEESEALEIGIGTGTFGNILSEKFKSYSGIDINEERVKIAKKNLPLNSKTEYKVGDALDIPFNKKFDLILYTFSWHFIEDFDKALEEAGKVLKENGVIIILEPSENTTEWGSPILRKDSPEFNERIYNRKLNDLKVARDFLHSQKKFKVQEIYNKELKDYLFILKLK